MLNLGDVNRGGEEASQSFEDAYVDWLEADTQFVNLMNALEIAEKAQATNSNECLQFAEDLLGTSCEVALTGSAAHIGRNAIANMKLAYKAAASLRKQLSAYMPDRGSTERVDLHNHILQVSHNGGHISAKEKPKQGTTSVQIWRAVVETQEALLAIMNSLGNMGFAVKNKGDEKAKQFIGYLKDDKAKPIVVDAYAKKRSSIAIILREARKLLRKLKSSR